MKCYYFYGSIRQREHDWIYESDCFGGAHMQHMRRHSSYPIERVDIT